MKKIAAMLLIVLTVLSAARGETLTFQDEFDGPKLDTTKWNTTFYWGGIYNENTGELQDYTNEAFSFYLGILSIQANRATLKDGRHYTSGLITTEKKFSQLYGHFEVRAKVPAGAGLWPAIWLLPEDHSWPPEIDIMETRGQYPSSIQTTVHFRDSQGGVISQTKSCDNPAVNYTYHYHVYAVDWRADSITWSVDGVPIYKSTTNIPNKKMYLLIDMAIGGSWAGAPTSTTPFPSYFQIDYVRVSK